MKAATSRRLNSSRLSASSGIVDRVQVLGDPEQGVQVAQAALALLDVGLDHVAAGAGPGLALVALLQLGGDELGAGALDHLLAEAALQLLGQRARRRSAGAPPGSRCGW